MNPNSYYNQKARGLKRKIEIIQSLGGCCSKCGYDKNLSALEFHHLDPNTKDFQIDLRHFSNMNLDSLKKELDKCILLCANCHREEHNPSLDKSNFENLLVVPKLSFLNPTGQLCPVCNTRFNKASGKIYCSKECRLKDKNYPTKSQLNEQYSILKSWEKVARHFNITRRIIQGILKSS